MIWIILCILVTNHDVRTKQTYEGRTSCHLNTFLRKNLYGEIIFFPFWLYTFTIVEWVNCVLCMCIVFPVGTIHTGNGEHKLLLISSPKLSRFMLSDTCALLSIDYRRLVRPFYVRETPSSEMQRFSPRVHFSLFTYTHPHRIMNLIDRVHV